MPTGERRGPRLVSVALVTAIAVASVRCASETADPLAVPFSVSTSSADLLVGEVLQLHVSGASGVVAWTSTAPAIATVSFGRVVGVGPGTATIVAASGEDVARTQVAVTRPAQVVLSVPQASFAAVADAALPAAATIAVSNGGDHPVEGLAVGPIAYGSGATDWLTASLAATVAPTTLTLRPSTTALAAGTYTATVPLTSTTATSAASIAVSYEVAPPAGILLSAASATFAARQATDVPPAQQIAVTNGGGGVLDGLVVGAITYTSGSSGWLTATLSGSTAPATLTLGAMPGAAAPGTHQATVTVAAPGVTARSVAVELTRTATLAGDVQPIIVARGCARSGCHDGASSALPDFSTVTRSWDTLVGAAGGVPSTRCAGLDRIEPGNPVLSCLYLKLHGDVPHAGGIVTGSDLTTIYTWILQGAARDP